MTLEDYVDDERLIAFERGETKGINRGRAEEKSSIALTMKQRNFPNDIIVSITGLPLEEVLAL